MSEFTKIAILGGSFDPVHKGHIQIAKQAKSDLDLDKVILLPCQRSPHKDNNTIANERQRVEMLSLASNQHDWIEISEWELNQENPSYSLLAARHFRETYPEARLYWIIGNDQWKKITTWYNIAELAEIITFIVFTRDQERPLDNPEIKSHIINYNFDASSTEIREKLAERQNLIQTIDSDVYEYIKDNRLYL